MVLTRALREKQSDSFPTKQLLILAICRLSEPIALTSIFPYAWLLVKQFRGEENASFYAGILISCFSLAEALTSMFWGSLSDRVGRKPVLLLGCIGTMLSMLIVGFSRSYWAVLLGRALGGILNGNIGVIQTMVGEMVKRPEHEPRAYAIMPFVWSIGTIVGPSIGGLLANPSDSMPTYFSPTSIFGIFPYLLPNLICAVLLFISIIASLFWLEETHPDMQPWSTQAELDHTTAQTPLMATAGSTANPGVDLRAESYGTFNRVDILEEAVEPWPLASTPPSRSPTPNYSVPTTLTATVCEKVLTHRVMMLVIALAIFSYHQMTYDHLLPIFLQDTSTLPSIASVAPLSPLPPGLGLSIQNVGIIMSINGLIALFIQGIVFPLAAERLGVWRLFVLVTLFQPAQYFIVPFLALLPGSLVYPGIYTCLTIRNLFSILGYPVLLIMLKEACPKALVLGRINGLAASAGAASRTLAPPLSGILYSFGGAIGFTGVAWWASGLVAMAGAAQVFWVKRERNKTAVVRGPAMGLAGEMDRKDVVVREVRVEV